MRVFSPFTLLLFLCTCSGDERVNNGLYVVHYPGTELIQQEVEMKNGKKNGWAKEYYKNGKLKRKQFYVNDTLNDSSLYYHDNGRLAKLQFLKDKKFHGAWRDFNKEGKLVEEKFFKDGLRDSVCTRYTYRTCKLQDRITYKMGEKDGVEEHFHSNGKLKSRQIYKAGIPCPGLEEYTTTGRKIENKVKIGIRERNELLLNGSLTYEVYLNNPHSEDKVYKLHDYRKGDCISSRTLLEKAGNVHRLVYKIPRGGFVMEQVWLCVCRKSPLGNDLVILHSFNAAAENH